MMYKRKEFLKTIGLTSVALPLVGLGGLMEACQSKKSAPLENPQNSAYPVFDLHCHPGAFFFKGVADYPGDAAFLKTLNQLSQAKMRGTIISLVTDMLLLERTPDGIKPSGKFEQGQAWSDFQRQMGIFKELISQSEAKFVTAIDQMSEDGGSVFLGCEGGDFLEGSTDRVDEAYEMGVRSIQLVHYAPNELGDLQTSASVHNGLSDAGKEVVQQMNKRGILIDVAHASYETVKSVARITDQPIMLSHSILKLEKGRPIEARAITEDHAKAVADTKGIIGAWPSGFNKSFDEFIDNTLRLIDVVGIDHVGLGTDMDSNFRPVITNYLEVPQWISALEKRGLSNEELKKLSSGNILRVLNETL